MLAPEPEPEQVKMTMSTTDELRALVGLWTRALSIRPATCCVAGPLFNSQFGCGSGREP